MTTLKHFKSNVDKQTIIDTLRTDGALILDNVLDASFIEALRGETDPYMDATANGRMILVVAKQPTGGLMLRSEKCRSLSLILEFWHLAMTFSSLLRTDSTTPHPNHPNSRR